MWKISKQLRSFLPGPSPSFLIGNLGELRSETSKLGSGVRVYDKWFNTYGDTILFQVGPIPMVYTRDIDLAKYITSNDPERFTKLKFDFLMKDITGKSLVLTDGEGWNRKRKLMRNAFKRQAIENFLPRFHEGAQELSSVWKGKATNGVTKDVEILPYISRFTMDVIGRCGFGVDFEAQKNPGKVTSVQDWSTIFEKQEISISNPFYALMGPNLFKKLTSHGKEYVEARKRILNKVNEVIHNRQKQGEPPKKRSFTIFIGSYQ